MTGLAAAPGRNGRHRHATHSQGDSDNMKPEQVHPAFDWLRSEPIESLNLQVEEYRHKETGAMHYHLAADKPENVFLVGLRTVPTDSTGVAHILEHTALCGSQRYPVRDPFFMMIRRSLNTFMNAFTSSDWTAYPFATQNRKDYFNLLDVYLDSVFFSRLHELDFAQEGHRVEFAEADDPASDLVFKGVVFNEMKGAMSSPVSTLWQTLGKHLFPSNTYHHNSGGEPTDIPDLSYRQLKDFYATHYHPSNAVFMTFGDIPASQLHSIFEERVLSRFEPLGREISVAPSKRYFAPLRVEEAYATEAEEAAGDKTHIVTAWLLGDSADLDAQLRTQLLADVLLDNSSSPLLRALETSELGSAPSPLCGMDDNHREMVFVCGVEGSRPERAGEVEELILEVLREVAENGVPQEQVEAMLHQLELQQREISGDGFPYGLQLIINALPSAIHRGDPVALLNLEPALARLRADAADADFIPRLVREQLLDNPHRVRLALRPDGELSARRERAEAARLAHMKAAMGADDQAAVVARAAALVERQQQEDDPDILPRVDLGDVPGGMDIASGEASRIGASPATFFDQGTNGLVYAEVVVDLPQLPDELLPLLPLYSGMLTDLGCGGRDYLQTQQLQAAVTGGISAYSLQRGRIDDVQAVRGHFVLAGKALARNADRLCELMAETLESPRFDEQARIRELIAQDRAAREQSVTGNGHGLAMSAAASGMSPVAALSHRLRGLAGIAALKQLDDGLGEAAALDRLCQQLAALHALVSAAPRQLMAVAEAEQRASLSAALARHWSAQPTADGFSPFAPAPRRERARQLWTTSTQVNFCAKAFPTVPVEHPDAAALAVLGPFLRNGFLHRAIRENGGAYGGGAGHDSDNACFRFFSYRDPRLADTLDDFDASIAWLLDEKHDWRQVEEAILNVVSGIDKPGSPAGEAKSAFHQALYGRSPEQREASRQRILDVRLEDLQRVGERYLRAEQASVAVITNAGNQQKAAERLAPLALQTFRL